MVCSKSPRSCSTSISLRFATNADTGVTGLLLWWWHCPDRARGRNSWNVWTGWLRFRTTGLQQSSSTEWSISFECISSTNHRTIRVDRWTTHVVRHGSPRNGQRQIEEWKWIQKTTTCTITWSWKTSILFRAGLGRPRITKWLWTRMVR